MSEGVRVIPCLDIDGGRVVKGVNFVELADAGDPAEMAAFYQHEGADELTFLDITASTDNRQTTYDVLQRIMGDVSIPVTVGGGVRSVDDVGKLLRAGAHKISVNTAAITDPELLSQICDTFGPHVAVLSVDARRNRDQPSGYEVTTHGGRRSAGLDAFEWIEAADRRGVGEILLNSMDYDGTRDGFDTEMITAARARTQSGLIASGGAGSVDHFCRAVEAGADAVLAASVFHFGVLTVNAVKQALSAAGYSVR